MSGAFLQRLGVFNPPPAGGGGSTYIASVQEIEIDITDGNFTGSTTFSSVDTSRSFLVWRGFRTDNADFLSSDDVLARVTSFSATGVTITRGTSAGAVTHAFTVVEATADLVDSVQLFDVSTTSGSGTATISSVTTSRSVVFPLGTTTAAGSSPMNTCMPSMHISSSTEVTSGQGDTNSSTHAGIVVQFNATAIQSIQQVTDAYTTSSTTDTKTISAVTLANCMIVDQGTITPTSGSFNHRYVISLSSTTNVNLVRGGTSTASRTPKYSIVEFVPGVLNSSQHGSINMTGDLTDTATISSVDTSASFAMPLGWNWAVTGASDNSPTFWTTVSLTNSTTVTAQSDEPSTAGDDVTYYGHQVVEFTSIASLLLVSASELLDLGSGIFLNLGL